MYYIVHLSIPVLYTFLYVCLSQSSKPLAEMLSSVLVAYFMFSSPHWVWAAASAYFEASKPVVIGAFIALHVLWLVVCLIVTASVAPEAASGWLLYLLGSPIAITFGAYIGKFLSASRRAA